MRTFLLRTNRFLDQPLDLGPRVLMLVAAACLVLTFFLPLWNLTMFAPQYPDGLRLDIYSHALAGGRGGQDVKEINVLNHYIGMKDLEAADFNEFKWIPFVVGAFGLLFLRTAVIGKVAHLLDVLVLYLYFGLFSLWSFAYKMYWYGHHLAPTAAVKVDPFTPPLFGYKKLANFEVYSYPALGSYALAGVALLLVVAFYLAGRKPPVRAA
jgi:hypothetical protein